MIARYDIIQRSEEWLRIKHAKIGGTLSKGLFVKSDTLLIEILSEINEDFEIGDEPYESYDMIRGVELEPIGREKLSEYIGIELKECGWLQCEEFDILGISPDGISQDLTVSAEIKCPAAKKHMSTIYNNDIPSDNIHQCLHYFTVNPKLEAHYFCSFRPENKLKSLFVKKLTRDSLIDLGTKAKQNIKKVSEWVEIAKNNVDELMKEIKAANEKLSF
jgi:hypothetical protein